MKGTNSRFHQGSFVAHAQPSKTLRTRGMNLVRRPVATLFANREAGLTVEEVMDEFSVTRETLPPASPHALTPADAHSL